MPNKLLINLFFFIKETQLRPPTNILELTKKKQKGCCTELISQFHNREIFFIYGEINLL